MTHKTTLLLLLTIFLSSSANALTRYVSDDLFTYVHSGPGTKYKIIGSVDAGERVKVLETNENAGFTQIKDSKDRIGWINSKYASKQPGLKERFKKLEIRFAKLDTQLRAAQDNLKSHDSKVRELENTNSRLNKELQQIQTLNSDLNEQLDTERIDLLLRWFTYGGIVGGVGLLLGLILPSLVSTRRKRSQW